MSAPISAFDILYTTHLKYVTRLARRLAHRDSDVASDLAQEAWLAVLQTPEDRWTEARYIRTVIFRTMLRWRAREDAQRVITPVRTPSKTPQSTRGKRVNLLHLRRHLARPHLNAIQPRLRDAA
ncbi:MAG TPA: sigma factor [Gemmatimonadaceae bacterium]|jgi:DNA-directed RNA polymerase specialized sigma24 family protein|nr:sigma factor [Gemmatimonadaceae bacterium]